MRDVIAGLIAVALLLVAASLATTLTFYRKRRKGARDSESARGCTIIAEIPTEEDLVLFTEDAERFYYGDRRIDKARITAVRVLINGSPIVTYESRQGARPAVPATALDDREEGIARDRWDVLIEMHEPTPADATVIIACGAIRERVSQELARAVFDAVKRDLERRDRRF